MTQHPADLFKAYFEEVMTKDEFFIRLLFALVDSPSYCSQALRLFSTYEASLEMEFTHWLDMATPNTEFLTAGMPSVKRTGAECHDAIVKWRECIGAYLVRAEDVCLGDKRRFVRPGPALKIDEVEVVGIQSDAAVLEFFQPNIYANPPPVKHPPKTTLTYDNGDSSMMHGFAMVWVYRRTK